MKMLFSFFLMLGVFLLPAFSFSAVTAPTELPLPENKEELKNYIQPTVSGRCISGTFGLVRNSGTRFHEGWDVKGSKSEGCGKVLDKIYSVLPGKVVHVCRENNGSYGKYVVLLHSDSNICFYSLYAHLDNISSDVVEGNFVKSGKALGVMGKTSSVYKIKSGFEHLHFEVGLILGKKSFLTWYDKSFPREDKNLHSYWNGLNLSGIDPYPFFVAAKKSSSGFFQKLLNDVPTAFSVYVPYSHIPAMIEESPGLALRSESDSEKRVGWKILFSWSGVPKKFIPLYVSEKIVSGIKIENVSEKYIQNSLKRGMLVFSDGKYLPGKNLKNTLEIIFGE